MTKVVESVIEVLGLCDVRDQLIGDEERRGISGGQRKRVNIAMGGSRARGRSSIPVLFHLLTAPPTPARLQSSSRRRVHSSPMSRCVRPRVMI
jgi:hypothetical protein